MDKKLGKKVEKKSAKNAIYGKNSAKNSRPINLAKNSTKETLVKK